MRLLTALTVVVAIGATPDVAGAVVPGDFHIITTSGTTEVSAKPVMAGWATRGDLSFNVTVRKDGVFYDTIEKTCPAARFNGECTVPSQWYPCDSPGTTYTFTGTATGPGGTVPDSATAKCGSAPPPPTVPIPLPRYQVAPTVTCLGVWDIQIPVRDPVRWQTLQFAFGDGGVAYASIPPGTGSYIAHLEHTFPYAPGSRWVQSATITGSDDVSHAVTVHG